MTAVDVCRFVGEGVGTDPYLFAEGIIISVAPLIATVDRGLYYVVWKIMTAISICKFLLLA